MNDPELVRRQYESVRRDSQLRFREGPDAYAESTVFTDAVPWPLPEVEGPFRSGVRATVFVAHR